MKKLDAFAALNAVLFVALRVPPHARFVAYRGAGHLEEFLVYSAAILAGIVALWWRFRDWEFDGALLALLQVGILMHFGGAFIHIDGARLYDAHLFGIRYDKFVHVVNAFAVAALVSRVFGIQQIAPTPLNALILIMVVLGLGAVVEIVEYVVVLTIPENGVGEYDNNMQDLIANLCGSVAFVVARSAGRGARRD